MRNNRKKQSVSPQVHRFLSEQGKKGSKIGGEVTRRLVELGRQVARERGEDVAQTARRKKVA